MASGRLSGKGYDEPTDSPDTESLLSEGSQEKLLPSSSLPTQNRSNRRFIYFHLVSVLFYGVITVLLYAWSLRLNAQKCECDENQVYCKSIDCELLTHEKLKLMTCASSGKGSCRI